MELKKANVTFNPEGHIYTNGDGRQLVSVTTILKETLFKGQYDNIPQEVLNRAAERGNKIHDIARQIDMFGLDESDILALANDYMAEGLAYYRIRVSLNLTPIEQEFLVADDMVAGQIDDLYTDEAGNIVMGERKSTSTFNKEYVAWQMGIYNYLLEKQTGIKAVRFYGWHNRDGKCIAYEIQAKTTEQVEGLLNAYLNGTPIQTVQPDDTLPAMYQDVELSICDLMAKKKAVEEQLAKLQDGMKAIMEENGIQSWKGEHLHMFIKGESIRETFDKAKLAKEHPELDMTKYVKVSKVKSSITFKSI